MARTVNRAHRALPDKMRQGVFVAQRFLQIGGKNIGFQRAAILCTELLGVVRQRMAFFAMFHGRFIRDN